MLEWQYSLCRCLPSPWNSSTTYWFHILDQLSDEVHLYVGTMQYSVSLSTFTLSLNRKPLHHPCMDNRSADTQHGKLQCHLFEWSKEHSSVSVLKQTPLQPYVLLISLHELSPNTVIFFIRSLRFMHNDWKGCFLTMPLYPFGSQGQKLLC